MGIWPYPDLVILDRICKNMIILPPQRKSLGASSFLYSIKCNLKYVYCSSGQNRQVIIYANLIYLYWFIQGVKINIGVCSVAIFLLSLFPNIFCLHSCKGKKKRKKKWLHCRIFKNLILLKMSCLLNWLFSSLISLFCICFIMLLIFSLWKYYKAMLLCMINELCLFVDIVTDFMFL